MKTNIIKVLALFIESFKEPVRIFVHYRQLREGKSELYNKGKFNGNDLVFFSEKRNQEITITEESIKKVSCREGDINLNLVLCNGDKVQINLYALKSQQPIVFTQKSGLVNL